jgi:V/A-type H+-transporting ATPase subunit F
MRIVAVGTEQFVLGFRLAGLRVTYSVSQDMLETKINEILTEGGVGILILHDDDFRKLSYSMRRKLSESVEPVVIPVGKLEEEDIREKIKKAVGIDLYG